MTTPLLPVISDRNAPCDVHWKAAVAMKLKRAGHHIEHFFERAATDAAKDRLPRVLVSLNGQPEPTTVLIAVLDPIKLPGGYYSENLSGKAWKCLHQETIPLPVGTFPDGVGNLVRDIIGELSDQFMPKPVAATV